MTSDTREMAKNAVALMTTLAIGFLVGRYGCTSEPVAGVEAESSGKKPQSAERVVEPAPPKIIYKCPPAAAEVPKKAGKRGKKPLRRLPTPADPADPAQRKRLLAWVRDRSSDLEGCRPDSKEIYRMVVRLQLDTDRRVTRVHLNVGPGELPVDVRQCIRTRLLNWVPPADLVKQRDQLVFGLTL